MTLEQELMLRVRTICGAAIEEAVRNTPYPPALLAALTANESGGNLAATRFESGVLGQLAQVIVGHRANFGSIGAEDLKLFCSGSPARSFSDMLLALGNLATSWGPTQIMGYQALAGHYPLGDLSSLDRHYGHAVKMLDDFAARFNLGPPFEEGEVNWLRFFYCWNTGQPDGKLTDPNYAVNGVARMATYLSLPIVTGEPLVRGFLEGLAGWPAPARRISITVAAEAATKAQTEVRPMSTTSSSPTSAKKVTWLSKVGAVVGKILKAVAGEAKPVADDAAAVATALFPQFAPEIAAADNLVTKIVAEAVAIEGTAAAAGSQTGTGAQKLESVLLNVGPAIDQWVAANFPGAKQVSAAAKAGLVNGVVAILNEIDPAAAPAGGSVTPSS